MILRAILTGLIVAVPLVAYAGAYAPTAQPDKTVDMLRQELEGCPRCPEQDLRLGNVGQRKIGWRPPC